MVSVELYIGFAVLYLILQLIGIVWLKRISKNPITNPRILSKKNLQSYYVIVTGANTV